MGQGKGVSVDLPKHLARLINDADLRDMFEARSRTLKREAQIATQSLQGGLIRTQKVPVRRRAPQFAHEGAHGLRRVEGYVEPDTDHVEAVVADGTLC